MSISVKDSMSGLLWVSHSSQSNFTNFCMSGFYATFMPIQYHYPQNICIFKLIVYTVEKNQWVLIQYLCSDITELFAG